MRRILSFGLVLLILISVLLLGIGCNKITGGGWFIDENTGNKITFGLNAQPLDEPLIVEMNGETFEGLYAKGQLQLIDHVTKERIHCTFVGTANGSDPTVSDFGGPATINGEGGYFVTVEINFTNKLNPEEPPVYVIAISVSHEDDPDNNRSIWGVLDGGSVKIHAK